MAVTMVTMADCSVCSSPARYLVEQAYLLGEPTTPFDRRTVGAHLRHASGQALADVEDLASASAVAARLRDLEVKATAILDAAIQQGDPRTALQALKEARATIAEMGRQAGHLAASKQGEGSSRPDLDALILGHLGGGAPADEGGEQAFGMQPPKALPSGITMHEPA